MLKIEEFVIELVRGVEVGGFILLFEGTNIVYIICQPYLFLSPSFSRLLLINLVGISNNLVWRDSHKQHKYIAIRTIYNMFQGEDKKLNSILQVH